MMRVKSLLVLIATLVTIKTIAQEPKLMLPIGHTYWVTSAAFSPDGKKVLTASYDNYAKLWDATSGKLLQTFEGHTGEVQSAVFSPDGERIVTASHDNTARIWDAQSGAMLHSLEGHTIRLSSATFSPDGKRIVTASYDNTARIWDAQSGAMLLSLEGHTSRVYSAMFSPDGKRIVTSSDDHTARIWDVQSGSMLHKLEGHTGSLSSATFSPDGKRIVTASFDTTARIWDAQSGSMLYLLKGHTNWVRDVVFSPDGKRIITASDDHTARIWDVQSGAIFHKLEGHTGSLSSATFSADGKRIVTASYDNTARIWDAQSGSMLHLLKGYFATFSPDGKRIVTASDDHIARIWDVQSESMLHSLEGHTIRLSSATFSPDGKQIVTASYDNTARIWDAQSGSMLHKLEGHTGSLSSTTFSPDGKRIVTASHDYTARIWDVQSGSMLHKLEGHTSSLSSATYSPDGKRIVTASFDTTARIWDAQSGSMLYLLKGHTNWVRDVVFSPDGKRIITASDDHTARIWDVQSGAIFHKLEGHTGSLSSATFSADGKRIVTASYDNTARIWDAQSESMLHILEGHTSWVYSATFSPDGKRIVTSSYDNTAKLWDVTTGKLIHTLQGHTDDVYYAVFSPDGNKVITASTDNTARLWESTTGNQIGVFNLGPNAFVTDVNWYNQKGLFVNHTIGGLIGLKTGKTLYNFLAVDSTDYLVVDDQNRYDGTPNARKLLYFTCDDEVIELDQVKDQLWVPGLAERIMKGETINAKTLSELNICGLVPLVEEKINTNNQYQFQITPRRGGLGETVLYVNGIEAKRYQTQQLLQKGSNYELNFSADELAAFMVAGQENKIIVKAYTKDNAISSRGATLLAANNTNAPTVIPNLYAVMVGVNDYKGTELDLKYAAKDATDLSNALGHSARKLLNTDGKEHVFIYNLTTAENRYQLPEKNSIKKVIEDIGKKATSSDILLLFFAGHGVTGTTTNDKQFYFLTADASKSSAVDAMGDVGISTAELSEWIKPQNLKAQKRILIFDACNSGQAIKDFVTIGQSGQNYLAARDDDKARQIKAIDKLNEKSGLFILSASASNQVAYEMGRYSQGMLTYALLSTIKQQPDILQDGKYLDVSRWFGAAEKMVTDLAKDNGARQQPQVISTTNFTIGLVDDEIRAKIVLPMEKPLFTSSNFQNANDDIAYDDKGLSKLVDQQLFDIASRGTNTAIVYTPNLQLEEAWVVSGNYEVIGTTIKARINIRQGKSAPKHRLEITGTTDKLDVFAKEIVQQVTKLVQVGESAK